MCLGNSVVSCFAIKMIEAITYPSIPSFAIERISCL